jgi:hypothetical protein
MMLYNNNLDLGSTRISRTFAFVNQPGILADGSYNFSLVDQNFGASLAGLIQINTSGLLTVTIQRLAGNFDFDLSTLDVYGWESNPGSAPVPEPGTLLLLGSGLVGMFSFGRKRMKG